MYISRTESKFINTFVVLVSIVASSEHPSFILSCRTDDRLINVITPNNVDNTFVDAGKKEIGSHFHARALVCIVDVCISKKSLHFRSSYV